jgi:hypothetical protein
MISPIPLEHRDDVTDLHHPFHWSIQEESTKGLTDRTIAGNGITRSNLIELNNAHTI